LVALKQNLYVLASEKFSEASVFIAISKNPQLSVTEQSSLVNILLSRNIYDYVRLISYPIQPDLLSNSAVMSVCYERFIRASESVTSSSTRSDVSWSFRKATIDTEKQLWDRLTTNLTESAKIFRAFLECNYFSKGLEFAKTWQNNCKTIRDVMAVDEKIQALIVGTRLEALSSQLKKLSKQRILYLEYNEAKEAGSVPKDPGTEISEKLFLEKRRPTAYSFFTQGFDSSSISLSAKIKKGELKGVSSTLDEKQRKLLILLEEKINALESDTVRTQKLDVHLTSRFSA